MKSPSWLEKLFDSTKMPAMLALVYILVISVVGDLICRRFFSYISIQHRLATAFLSGLLFSSCFTYLATLLFSGAASPLSWGNLVFFATATLLITWLRHGSRVEQPGDGALLYFRRNIFPSPSTRLPQRAISQYCSGQRLCCRDFTSFWSGSF